MCACMRGCVRACVGVCVSVCVSVWVFVCACTYTCVCMSYYAHVRVSCLHRVSIQVVPHCRHRTCVDRSIPVAPRRVAFPSAAIEGTSVVERGTVDMVPVLEFDEVFRSRW